jgi:hypothetical protein
MQNKGEKTFHKAPLIHEKDAKLAVSDNKRLTLIYSIMHRKYFLVFSIGGRACRIGCFIIMIKMNVALCYNSISLYF